MRNYLSFESDNIQHYHFHIILEIYTHHSIQVIPRSQNKNVIRFMMHLLVLRYKGKNFKLSVNPRKLDLLVVN